MTFRSPQTRRPTLPPALPISAVPAATRAAPPLPASLPGGIISPRAASNPSDSPTSAPYRPFSSPSSSPLDSYTAATRVPSPLELAPRSSSVSQAAADSKSCFDCSGDRRRLQFCCALIALLVVVLIVVVALAASGKLKRSQSEATAGGDAFNAAPPVGESSTAAAPGGSSGARTTVTVSPTAETVAVTSADTVLPSATSSAPQAQSTAAATATSASASGTFKVQSTAAPAATSASASGAPAVGTVPSLSQTWSLSASCPAVLGQNDAARPASSPCWHLEWFSLFAAKLQSASLLQGAPAMQGNWSAFVSGLVQNWIGQHNYWGACDDNPMIYPLQQSAEPEAAQPQAGGRLSLLVYVSAASGSDSTGAGTISAPFQSLLRALAFSRTRAMGTPAAIILRAGDYYFSETLLINQPVDSQLTIMAQPSERVTFWGGQPFTPSWSWTRVAATNATVLVTPIPSSINTSWSAFNELMVNGQRQVRARFPNGNSFLNVMCDASWSVGGVVWGSLASFPAPSSVSTGNVRSNYAFNFYQMGFNGSALPYLNQQNYWSQLNPSAGSYRGQYSGFTYKPAQFTPRITQWTQVESSFIHTPHVDGWGSWQLQLSTVNTASSTVNISGGGFQESRGANQENQGVSCLFIDHQLAELDAAGEFYIDAANRLLYWMPNSSQAEAPPTELLASQVMTVLWISGGLQSVAVQGIAFTHTANSFMAPHMASGGGDWANTVEAAVRITDCANCSVTYCLFTQLGGNGVVVEQSSNGSLVAYNEFSYLGANAVAIMGVMLGFNATLEWTQPRDSRVLSNLMHDVGKYNKQSGGVYNTLAYRSVVQGNVIATTPRSGVNFNDGFAGGHVFAYNLMINTAMETSDVGPFNSWNRNPYYFLSSVSGHGSWDTDPSYNHHNLIMVDNQSPGIDAAAFDHDDGSTAFVNYQNVLVNSRTKLYLGTNITYDGNLLLPLSGFSCWWFPTLGPRSRYQNNICMQLGEANLMEHAGFAYDLWANGCSESGLLQQFPSTFNNSYYLSTSYNSSQPAVSCNGAEYSLAAFQAFNSSYAEPGSSLQPLLPQYPYYRYVGANMLGLSGYLCFNNTLNSQYSSALARAQYVMPLQQNLTEITTGDVGMDETVSGGQNPGVATFTNKTSRGGAWTGQGYSLFLLPPVIGFLGASYSQTFWAMTAPGGTYPTVFLSGPQVSTPTSFFTQLSPTPDSALGFSHGAAGQLLCTYLLPTSLSAGSTWYHVGVTFNASTLVASLYVNGQLVNRTGDNPVWQGGSRIQAGYLAYRSYPYNGLMQWLTWANYELSAAQVAAAYTSTLAL